MAQAKAKGIVTPDETAILDATAHAIKFSGFQDLYFKKEIPETYGIQSDDAFINLPDLISPDDPNLIPSQEKRLGESDFTRFVDDVSGKIAKQLDL